MTDSVTQIALVTGGAGGIGTAVSRSLAEAGFRVGVHYRSKEKEAAALAEELGGFAIGGDLSDTEAIDGMIAKLKEDHGRLDVLVNNAGLNVNAPLMMMSLGDIDRVRAVTRGALYLTKLAIRRFMFRQKSGRIINISSVVGHMGNAGQIPYTMEKAGLDALTRSLAMELQDRGILVNSVAPGMIETDMTDEMPADAREAVLSQIPLKRLGRPEEVAEVVHFLATSGTYVTGTVIHVNGGLYRG